MKNNITNLEIKNFKSIKDLHLGCKRINIFIGEPNVGKSNILEALSLFITPYCPQNSIVLKDYIRFEKLSNLFYDQDRKNSITVKTNIGFVNIRFHLDQSNIYEMMIGNDESYFDNIKNISKGNFHTSKQYFDNQVRISDSSTINKPFFNEIREDVPFTSGMLTYDTPIKRYIFKPLSIHNNHLSLFLSPPYGENLYTILESNPGLYDTANNFFTKYGLDLLIDTETNKLDVQKRVGNRVYKIPYSLVADTLQRIIFHLAAIETNNDSVLLFEEPESHSYPPYISDLADKIIEKKDNQFFIATHSPYLLTPFIEQCSLDEVAIFVCTYKNYETKAKVLTKEEIENIMETGIDLFYNIDAFKK